MSTISKLIAAYAVLSSVALAAPILNRDLVLNYVTETVWTTVDYTQTIYDFGTFTSTAPPPFTTPVEFMTPSTSSTSSSAAGSLFVAGWPSTLAVATMPLPSTATAPAAGFYATPASSAVPTSAPPSSTSAAAPIATNAVAAVAAGSITASTTGTCEGGSNACVGDVTHWDGGLGACGTNVDTNVDFAVALPYAFMGTLSNTNPYCGRSLTLFNPTSGTTVKAVVMDKCMGCVDRAIDCTDVLFTAITDGTGNGRVSGIEWWLN